MRHEAIINLHSGVTGFSRQGSNQCNLTKKVGQRRWTFNPEEATRSEIGERRYRGEIALKWSHECGSANGSSGDGTTAITHSFIFALCTTGDDPAGRDVCFHLLHSSVFLLSLLFPHKAILHVVLKHLKRTSRREKPQNRPQRYFC